MDPFWRCSDARIPFGISGILILKIYGIKEKRCPIADWIRRGLYLYKYICGSGGGLTQKIPREIISDGKW